MESVYLPTVPAAAAAAALSMKIFRWDEGQGWENSEDDEGSCCSALLQYLAGMSGAVGMLLGCSGQ